MRDLPARARRIREHIFKVVGRYRRQIHQWHIAWCQAAAQRCTIWYKISRAPAVTNAVAVAATNGVERGCPDAMQGEADMHVMSYEITLPADYNMAIIRRRVADRGSTTDAFPGLGLKAYLMRERDGVSSPVNAYATFYLWASADPAAAVTAALADAEAQVGTDGAHSTTVAIEPLHWRSVTFTLWSGPAPGQTGTRYSVLHISSPGVAELPRGRQW